MGVFLHPRAPVASILHLASLALSSPACMEQQSRRHGKGKPMEDDADLLRLFGVLDTLGAIARAMHPSRLDALIEKLDDQDLNVADAGSPGGLAAQACAALRAAPAADNPMQQAYRALRYY